VRALLAATGHGSDLISINGRQFDRAQADLWRSLAWVVRPHMEAVMIGLGRSIRIKGDPIAALAFAREIVEHIKKWPGVKRSVCWQNLSGPTGTLVFFSECEDLATFDKIQTFMMEDKAYWSKVAQAREKGLFELASSQDLLMRQVV